MTPTEFCTWLDMVLNDIIKDAGDGPNEPCLSHHDIKDIRSRLRRVDYSPQESAYDRIGDAY